MTDERCRHNRFWVLCMGYWLWCYECGAMRKCTVELNVFTPVGHWQKPVGKGGENPALKE